MEIKVRVEEERDYRRSEEVARAAFGYPERVKRGGIGCPYEHWMVHELRSRDGIAELNLVAELENGEIVGQISGSRATVRKDETETAVLNFGPLSVLPEYQRMGVGKALMRAFVERARTFGFGAILFFGRPEYYPQFGFREAEVYGISTSDGDNFPAFMAMELKEGYLGGARGGRFFESDIYNDELNRDAVIAFDKEFVKGESV